MKRIRITHSTEYHYTQPVTFGPHRALMRPREGHDVRIVKGRVEIEPTPTVRWLRDIESNSVAVITFEKPGSTMRLFAEVDVDLHDDSPIECLIDPHARLFPFQYPTLWFLGGAGGSLRSNGRVGAGRRPLSAPSAMAGRRAPCQFPSASRRRPLIVSTRLSRSAARVRKPGRTVRTASP